MQAMGSSQGRIRDCPGYLRVDCGDRIGAELSEIYRAFAAICIAKQAQRVLVSSGDGDIDGHRALRDALATMLLAGIPAGFRIALVTGNRAIERMFHDVRSDLRVLDIEAGIYATEKAAVEWLLAERASKADPRIADDSPKGFRCDRAAEP
jgi:hypothetical protein